VFLRNYLPSGQPHFGGRITKILQHKLQNIAASELVEVLGGWFGKATVTKSNAQLHRFHAQLKQAPPVRRDLGASSSSSSLTLVVYITYFMDQLTIMTEMLTSQSSSIEKIKTKLAHMETDLE
jgi:hypothetical protein